MNIVYKTLFCFALTITASTYTAEAPDADFAIDPNVLAEHVIKAAPNFPINGIFHNKKFYMVSNEMLMVMRAQLIYEGKYQPHLKERQEQGLPPLYSPKILKKVGWVGDDYGYIPRKFDKKRLDKLAALTRIQL